MSRNKVRPCHVEYISGNIKIYLYILSFINIETCLVAQIHYQWKQEHSTQYHDCWWSDDAQSKGIWALFHKGFMSSLMKSCENSVCANFYYNYPIRSQFCLWHNSCAVGTCANLWHDWISILYVKKMHIFYKIWIMISSTICEMGPCSLDIDLLLPEYD